MSRTFMTILRDSRRLAALSRHARLDDGRADYDRESHEQEAEPRVEEPAGQTELGG